MRASEIRRLARRARIGPGVPVRDACCGAAGPGRLIAADLGCDHLGVDHSAAALEGARRTSGDPPCRFERVQVPPLPEGRFAVVLLETMPAFPDKPSLLTEVARALDEPLAAHRLCRDWLGRGRVRGFSLLAAKR